MHCFELQQKEILMHVYITVGSKNMTKYLLDKDTSNQNDLYLSKDLVMWWGLGELLHLGIMLSLIKQSVIVRNRQLYQSCL